MAPWDKEGDPEPSRARGRAPWAVWGEDGAPAHPGRANSAATGAERGRVPGSLGPPPSKPQQPVFVNPWEKCPLP